MKKILNYIIIGAFVSLAYNCEEDATSNSVNYIAFGSSSESATVDVGAVSSSVDVAIYAGNESGSDRTFNLMVDTDNSTADASAYSVPSTVTIPGGSNEGIFTVQLNESGLDFAFSSIVVEFAPNQGVFTSPDTDSVTINAGLVCPTSNEITIDISTDAYPDETTWSLVDGSGATVASGGPYSTTNSTESVDLSLTPGSYTMTLLDSYGDGGSSFTVANGCMQGYASGSTPDAGGGYPVLTSVTGSFTIN